jgi:hypothetical protein
MKADLRISIKDYRRNKNLKVLPGHLPYSHRQRRFAFDAAAQRFIFGA